MMIPRAQSGLKQQCSGTVTIIDMYLRYLLLKILQTSALSLLSHKMLILDGMATLPLYVHFQKYNPCLEPKRVKYRRTSVPFVYIFFQASSGKCTSVVQGTLVLLYFIPFGGTKYLFKYQSIRISIFLANPGPSPSPCLSGPPGRIQVPPQIKDFLLLLVYFYHLMVTFLFSA